MKATFFLPAHPSYFDPALNVTQEEIDRVYQIYDERHSGIISKGRDVKVRHEFVLLREPGKSIQVVFDSAGLGDGRTISEIDKQIGLEQFRRTSNKELQTHVHNITEYVKMLRRGDFDTSGPLRRW
jgi:hypothetical protein